ncbi:MAG: hypothetical protein QOG65_1172 [Actinomycetota bacterium]|jgi:hypothetical protein|nr:hypothetical protein [Actinomycetota bacterium]
MSGFMPYLVEKGPYLSVLESKLAQPKTRAGILRDLYAGVALADLVGFDSTNLVPDGMSEAERKRHLNEDWFGFNGQPMFWVGFDGKPEIIMREGMIRAIEMSFGLEHGDPAPDDAKASSGRHWPIDVYWICQGPWFQCWVLWRAAANDEGHVTLMITTPAAYGYPLTAKITRPVHANQGPYTAEDYAHPPEQRAPKRPALEKGMWVVGHEDYTRKVRLSTVRARHRDIKIPRVVWVANDSSKVECVAPAEREGGVLDDPRRYVAPVPRP